LLAGNPIKDLMEMESVQAARFLHVVAAEDQDWPEAPPQYLTVSWENLRLAGWISYYGNWDIVTGTSSPGKMQRVQGEVRIDSAAGTMTVNGQPAPIDSLDVIEEEGTRHFEWPNGSGSHVLINQAARQVYLMDAKMYRSMMVQMLIAPPENFAEDFELVVDRYPWVRAYKVKG
jgi:dolichyl-diphosphooligosaccharide--protein glycosyltransferase